MSGVLAFAWLFLWYRVGADRPEGSGGVEPPKLVADESGDKGVGGAWTDQDTDDATFPKKDDPPKLTRWGSAQVSRSANAGDSGGGRGVRANGMGPLVAAAPRIPWGVMMRSPAVCAIVVNNFAFHYATYVMMNWLPTYFQKLLAVDLYEMNKFAKVSVRKSRRQVMA